MQPNPLTPAERVALLIKKLDVTTYQFGKATGISHQTLSNVLTGKNKPGLDTLQAIAAVYPAAAVFLLTGQGEPFPDGVRGDKLPSMNSALDSAPAAAAEVEPLSYGDAVELAVANARIADRDETIRQQQFKIDELNRELGKPFNGLDAAGPRPVPTPATPIGFRLAVSHRVKSKGAARPL